MQHDYAVYLKVISDEKHENTTVQRFNDFPVRIGRHPQNHVILSDASVSAFHAEIQIDREKNGIYIIDISSTNGLLYLRQKVSKVEIGKTSTSIQVGRVWIELTTSEDFLENTQKLDWATVHGIPQWSSFKANFYLTLSILLVLVLSYLQLSVYENDLSWNRLFSLLLKTYGKGVAISTGLAFFSKIHLRHYQFIPFATYTFLAQACLILRHVTKNIIDFNINAYLLSTLMDHGLIIILSSFLGYHLIRHLFPTLRRRFQFSILMSFIFACHSALFGIPFIKDRDDNSKVDSVIAWPVRLFPPSQHTIEKALDQFSDLDDKIKNDIKESLEEEAETEAEVEAETEIETET